MVIKKIEIFAFCISLFTASIGIAQQNPVLPDARTRAHLIYHPQSEALLLFDGYMAPPDSTQNNVWKWDGKKWKCVESYGPDSRMVNAGALNNETGNVELFGGWGKKALDDKKDDVWEFNGSKWFRISTNNIGTRDHHKMIYADHLNAFVVYGGFDYNFQPDTITWLLEDDHFTALQFHGPGARGNHGLAYDPLRKKVILFGGKWPSVATADLWEFDGKKWEEIPVEDIGVTTIHSIIYSDELKMIVIHNTRGETWGWNGKKMTKIANDGPVEFGVALGYDPKRKVIAASLWELKNGTWKKVADNGTWIQINRDESERMKDEVAEIFHLANKLMAENNLIEGESLLKKMTDSGMATAILYAQLGQLQFTSRRYTEAAETYEKLLSIGNIYPAGAYYLALARCYAKINNNDKAFEALNKTIEYGYGSKQQLENDTDLESLRTDARFKILLEKLK